MNQRRFVSFDNWDEVLDELHRLQTGGYQAVGKWNLAQICKHLNDWLSFPMDGFPVAPLPMRWMLMVLRVGFGKRLLRGILEKGRMASGGPTMNNTVYPSDSATDADAVRQLEDTIRRFDNFRGNIHPSPVFGAMDKATAARLQLVHMAHHLSFLIPKT